MLRRPTGLLLSLLTLTVLLDQLTKSAIRVLWSSTARELPFDGLASTLLAPRFPADSSLPVAGEFLQITHVRNTGAAFGMLPGYRPVFMAATVLVLVAIAAYWRRHAARAWPIVVGLGLISGGALGNLIDRTLTGKVTDFIYVAVIDFPVFNVADSALVVGVGILMAWLLFGPEGDDGSPQVEVELAEVRSPGGEDRSPSDGGPERTGEPTS